MPLRILIADDNAVFRTTLRRVLQAAASWDIVDASDGQEAVSKAVATLPDIIILDLAMPAKDGLAAAREISQLLPHTPIIMCTMHMTPYLEGEALKSGVRKILSKSDSNLLIETVRQLLPAAEAPAAPTPAIDPLPPPDATPSLSVARPAPGAPPDTNTEPPAPPLPKSVA